MPAVFFDTYYDNASPLAWTESAPGTYDLTLIADHERFTGNCQITHWNFKIVASEAAIGTDIVLRFHAADNTWNGRPNPPLRSDRLTSCVRHGSGAWHPIRMSDSDLEDVRKEITIRLTERTTQICNVVPYTVAELTALTERAAGSPIFRYYPIGATVEGRPLEMMEIGRTDAPNTILLRARAHPWESGGSWFVDGLVRGLLDEDIVTGELLDKVCVCVMPMASKDGVARGMTRYNLRGCDLNRGWEDEHSFQPELCPENYALQSWLNDRQLKRNLPDVAICLHNDDNGMVHLSPADESPPGYTGRMKRFTSLLEQHTWFDEGVKESVARDTFGAGLCRIYEIDAFTYELNASWSSGLGRNVIHDDWIALGKSFIKVLSGYFGIQ